MYSLLLKKNRQLNKTKTVNSKQYSSRKQGRIKGFQQTAGKVWAWAIDFPPTSAYAFFYVSYLSVY